ncbi:spore germination protein [Rummeliibacillus stabekisii]|uniref:GerAB/ArcD/ProY family transporter n=1 Tax=Rummeliibacillus stabekisii TaxID=241244 RepID=UPI00203C861C|nr:GerAB/ArcD/ProY family transporter [Rummeliibacillus stabekisii]MCM3315427.1 spore germination protein [Rummeliibacillus stabekisii]
MNFTITKVQLFLMLFFRTTGIIFIGYPQTIILAGGRDAWIMFFVSSFIVFFQLWLYEKLYKYFKIGKFTAWIYIFFWIIVLIGSLIYMQYNLNIWVQQNTPNTVSLVLMLLISFYISVSRPSTVINLPVFIIPFIFIFIIYLLFSIPELSLNHLFPIGTSTGGQWMKGTMIGLAAFTGIEGYLVLRKHVLPEDKISFKEILIYQLSITLFIGFLIIATKMYFATDALPLVTEPILYILKSIEVTFVKRLDIFFFFIWLGWSIISFSLIVLNIRIVYFKQNRKYKILPMAILHLIVFIGCVGIVNIQVLEFMRNHLQYYYIPVTIILPAIIMLINKRRKSKCAEL